MPRTDLVCVGVGEVGCSPEAGHVPRHEILLALGEEVADLGRVPLLPDRNNESPSQLNDGIQLNRGWEDGLTMSILETCR
jgi:hypothetical protein